MNKVHSIKSINKAFDILEAFLTHPNELTLTDIAQISGINRPTANRIISNLVTRGYLIQKEKRGKYALGHIFFSYSGNLKRENKLRDIARHYLMSLSDFLDESIIMSYGDIYEGIFTETFHGENRKNKSIKIIPDEGYGMPLHCSCAGKLYLAELSEADFNKYFSSRPLQGFTQNTIVDLTILKKMLSIVKREGVSYDDEEYSIGVRSVGAGIRNSDGNLVATIAVIAPSPRLPLPKMKEIAATIKTSAMQISTEIGYISNPQ
jgi:IclR family transcriptional regulator, acetate operon repressor